MERQNSELTGQLSMWLEIRSWRKRCIIHNPIIKSMLWLFQSWGFKASTRMIQMYTLNIVGLF